MKKMFLVIGMLAAFTVAGSTSVFAIARSGSLEQVTTLKNTGASKTETTKVFWEDNRMRIERYTLLGLLIEIQNGQNIYIYSPKDKQAIKSPPGNKMSVQDRLKAMSQPVKGGKKVGAGTVAGMKCDVFVASSGGMDAKWYASTDSRFPLKLRTYITRGSASELTEIKNLKLNYNVPDGLFSLPKGTKIVEAKKASSGKQ